LCVQDHRDSSSPTATVRARKQQMTSQSEATATELKSRSSSHATMHGVCTHVPACPGADGPDRDAAHVIASHPEQGWSLLCNGVVLFDDDGELLPDGRAVAHHRDFVPLLATA
jgi:hypothetical protein